MAKVMASTYQYVNDDGEMVTLRPGDDPKDLPKDVRKDLEDARLIEDEKRMTADGYRKTAQQLMEEGEEEEEEQLPRFTPVRSQSQLVNQTSEIQEGNPDEDDKKSSSSKGDKK